MTVNEVYAINIQPRQFVKDLQVSLEEVETEREIFLRWLNETKKKFLSQMDAWNVYIAPLNLALAEIVNPNDLTDDEFELDMILNRALYGWRPQ